MLSFVCTLYLRHAQGIRRVQKPFLQVMFSLGKSRFQKLYPGEIVKGSGSYVGSMASWDWSKHENGGPETDRAESMIGVGK